MIHAYTFDIPYLWTGDATGRENPALLFDDDLAAQDAADASGRTGAAAGSLTLGATKDLYLFRIREKPSAVPNYLSELTYNDELEDTFNHYPGFNGDYGPNVLKYAADYQPQIFGNVFTTNCTAPSRTPISASFGSGRNMNNTYGASAVGCSPIASSRTTPPSSRICWLTRNAAATRPAPPVSSGCPRSPGSISISTAAMSSVKHWRPSTCRRSSRNWTRCQSSPTWQSNRWNIPFGGGGCVFHGFLPPNPWEGCHSIHGKPATQSTGNLPLNPRQGCHPLQAKPATVGAQRRWVAYY